MHLKVLLAVAATVTASLMAAGGAAAANNCEFETSGGTKALVADCVTDETIVVPDGMTLDGSSHTITAQDPAGGHFTGAVVANEGDEAYVTNLGVTVAGLANVCDGGDDRLRGIMFEGAHGAITKSEVTGVNQGPSGCQEGNAIEVRNEPFDFTGTNPGANPLGVRIAHNVVSGYQKSGIVANGTVDARIVHNVVGESATQQNLAANSVQLGFGARGLVEHNRIAGNQWLGASNTVATAVLLHLPAASVTVSLNNIVGNSDAGIYAYGSGLTIDNNRVFDQGPDGPHGDYGIINFEATEIPNQITNNKVRGFDQAYYGVSGGKNKTIPGPQGHAAF
jgi:parallel beta-helix repeat protein